MKARATSAARVGVLAVALSFTLACGEAPYAIPPSSPSLAGPPEAVEGSSAPPPAALEGKNDKPAPAPAGPAKWSYTGDDGPAHWGDLSADWAGCKTGKQQSPIDVPKGVAKGKGLAPIVFAYSPLPIQIVNTGFTVQAMNTTPSSITIGADKYTLVQFHLHTPSEHTLEGKRFDGELHFVHKSDKGEVAVVAVLLKKGKENKTFKALLDNAPKEAAKEPKSAPGTFDLSPFTGAKTAYVTYPGSLTIPPCTEGLRWLVLTKTAEIGEAQIAKLQELTHGPTSRPIQPLEGRSVTSYP
jgi:carbonic anhydrase